VTGLLYRSLENVDTNPDVASTISRPAKQNSSSNNSVYGQVQMYYGSGTVAHRQPITSHALGGQRAVSGEQIMQISWPPS